MADSWLTCFLSTYGPLVTPGAILISAAVAVGVMIYNAQIARRRATVDLIMNSRQNESFSKARKVVLNFQEDGTQFSKFALAENAQTDENQCVLVVLNFNEFVAVGIRENAFDEKTYKRLRKTRYIRDWETLETYVAEFRKSRKSNTLFSEFEWLAKRWAGPPWWRFWQ